MRFITITGIDKSGKTTLINAFMEATNHENYVIDRSPDTFHFFNVLQNRIAHRYQHFNYNHFSKKFAEVLDLAVLLKVDCEVLEKRFIESNEPRLVGNLSMYQHQKEIERYFDNANYKNVLKIDTSEHSIEECVKLIKEKIKCL